MAPSKFCPGSVFLAVGMGRLEQLSIRRGTKKRDFCRKRVFHRGDFLESLPEKFEEMQSIIGSILANIFYPKSIASSAN
jgi:hypothetical protein